MDHLNLRVQQAGADDGGSHDEFDDDEIDYEAQQYLYMELKSTASFKDVDIDAMLEHTTFDEFMRGLYNSRVLQRQAGAEKHPHAAQFDKMMDQVFQEDAEDE